MKVLLAHSRTRFAYLLMLIGSFCCGDLWGQDKSPMKLSDVFELEFASDPQLAPNGSSVVFVRNSMDIMTDRTVSQLWLARSDGSSLRPITSGLHRESSPRWSPDGSKIYYLSSESGTNQIHCYWLDNGQTSVLSRLKHSPGSLKVSPDGTQLSFTMRLPKSTPPLVQLKGKPKGAEWAAPARVISELRYRADGRGFLPADVTHLFVMGVEGGTPRQLTIEDENHSGDYCWSPDSRAIVFSANLSADKDQDPLNSELHEIDLETGKIKQLTTRKGPDQSPAISPDGSLIAYVGFDDEKLGYQTRKLTVMHRDGSLAQEVLPEFGRSIGNPVWSKDGSRLWFQFDDQGVTQIGELSEGGKVRVIATDLGGTTLGRPYSSGSFHSSSTDAICYVGTSPEHPADVMVISSVTDSETPEPLRLTHLNDDLFAMRSLGKVEELRFESTAGKVPIQGWLVKPPNWDPSRKYPLILEIHGGPFANYGPRFSAEMQLYAAAGYLVLYVNPRGSTSYGQDFGNLIHHNYPGEDYDDLMTAVDQVIIKENVDPERLFVTGGSGGGVLTAWIVGKTDRFKAAVVAKPVINWYSFALTSDAYNVYYQYWFPGPPWEYPQQYLDRSPISLVGNVETPTMLLTGESDFRTPISETEQYYQALQLRGIESVMVRIPNASHGIAARPSNLMSKVAHILKWFEMHDAAVED